MATYYVRTDGSDSNNGSANDSAHAFLTVAHAVASASSADTIYAVAGPFPEGNVVLDLAAKNLTLTGIGAAPVEVTFTSNEVASGRGAFLNGGFVSNIYSHGVVDNSSSFTYQAPAGWQGKSPTFQTAWTSASYTNCKFDTDADGLFMSSPAGAAASTATLIGCQISSRFDTINLTGQGPTGQWAGGLAILTDCNLRATSPTPATASSHIYRGVTSTTGKIRMIGGAVTVDATNDSNVSALTGGVISGGNGHPRYEMIGVTISTASVSGTEFSISISSTSNGKCCLANCTYDASKIDLANNLPSVVTVRGGVRQKHAAGSTYSLTFVNGTNTAFDGMKVNGSAVTATFSGGSVSWSIPTNYSLGSGLLVELSDSAAAETAAIDLIGVVASAAKSIPAILIGAGII